MRHVVGWFAPVLPDSRLAAAIGLGRDLAVDGVEPTDAYARLEAEFAGMHWVHALNNTALLTYGLAAAGLGFGAILLALVATALVLLLRQRPLP